ILLVAANQKVPQPQSREHLLALQTLGITQIVVVQNKVDLISYQDALSNYSDITKFVKGTNASKSPIIPVSAQSGLNLDALISTIENDIKTPERDESKDSVMHVLRSFDINKPGSTIDEIKGGVIGGSLTQGIFKIGDEIEIKPGLNNEKKQSYEPIFTEITSLGTGAGTVDSVKPGGLVAIGTKLDPTLTRGDSLLGSIVGKPDSLPDNSNNAKVEVSLFDSAVGSANEEKITPIKTGENLRVNIGTAPILGKVTNVKSDNIELSFRRPVCLFEKSNIALSRRISDRWRLIGAGIVG
ncbi:MAG: translation initiation factor IF-2 subunit gamma, partial [Thermoproteota archaeon]|nr:translation initiation factor IF-2 subunit gamma [Thermoproteota archaeon]